MTQIERLEENEVDPSEIMLIDDEAYCESLIGTAVGTDKERAVYDFDKMVEEYADFHGVSHEEAADHINFNVIRSLPYYGENAPIIVNLFMM